MFLSGSDRLCFHWSTGRATAGAIGCWVPSFRVDHACVFAWGSSACKRRQNRPPSRECLGEIYSPAIGQGNWRLLSHRLADAAQDSQKATSDRDHHYRLNGLVEVDEGYVVRSMARRRRGRGTRGVRTKSVVAVAVEYRGPGKPGKSRCLDLPLWRSFPMPPQKRWRSFSPARSGPGLLHDRGGNSQYGAIAVSAIKRARRFNRLPLHTP